MDFTDEMACCLLVTAPPTANEAIVTCAITSSELHFRLKKTFPPVLPVIDYRHFSGSVYKLLNCLSFAAAVSRPSHCATCTLQEKELENCRWLSVKIGVYRC